MQSDDDIWFRAKRYGYGWGFPVRWQGWVVLAGYIGLTIVGARYFIGGNDPAYFVLYLTALSVVLIAICAWKGEPLRWRWGGK